MRRPDRPRYGPYRVLREVGRGASGTVLAAEHTESGRRVALKVLHPELSQSREAVSRFFHEARATNHIDDPGIVEVFDFGYAEAGEAYIAMELLAGESLGGLLTRAPRPELGFVRHVGTQIASTLAVAHAQQIIHRDLKPDNVFLVAAPREPYGVRVKVLDFGMAKLNPEGGPYSFVTEQGTLFGTPMYMAPEQCRGGKIDARSDVYALGCILYELACGRPPFVRGGVGLILGAHVYEPVTPPRTLVPELPELLEAVLLCTLEKQPEGRFSSMQALAQALSRALDAYGGARG